MTTLGAAKRPSQPSGGGCDGFPATCIFLFLSHQFLTSLCLEETDMITWDEISLSPMIEVCFFLFPIGHSVKH